MRQVSSLHRGFSRVLGELGTAFLGGGASWWRVFHFGALALVMALSPATYDRENRAVTANQIYFTAWQVLPWFTLLAALLSLVLIRIVVETTMSYGLSQYALEMVVRVLVLELIPLFAALFVALRSGAAINTEVALMHIRGDFDALRRAGVDPLRRELVPRVIGSAVSVVALAAVSGVIALALAYIGVYGFSPWGFAGYTRMVGHVFDLQVTLGLALKTLLFGLAVAVIPITASLETPREVRLAPVAVLRGMVRLFLVLVLLEGASLAVKYI
ncbi:MAG: ABC transporter permease [Betaproteobacteria bacterium RIFCSPLOWO2_12_FULL_64_23]|nr:MAG: ABC transporter permease [Betaproteobacteria bacterium RIFCSPLOWO2_12_FULL_64_23]